MSDKALSEYIAQSIKVVEIQYELFKQSVLAVLKTALNEKSSDNAELSMSGKLSEMRSRAFVSFKHIVTQIIDETLSQRFYERGVKLTEAQLEYTKALQEAWVSKIHGQIVSDILAVKQKFNRTLMLRATSEEEDFSLVAMTRLDTLGREYQSALFVSVQSNAYLHKMINDIAIAIAIAQDRPVSVFDPRSNTHSEYDTERVQELLHPRARLIVV